jgi:hypothetical protein
LRNNGYSSSAAIDIIDAITVLLNYGLISKIPPATIISTNPALASLAMTLGGIGPSAGPAAASNFSSLTSILAASMATSINNNNNNNTNIQNFNYSEEDRSSPSQENFNGNPYQNGQGKNNYHSYQQHQQSHYQRKVII